MQENKQEKSLVKRNISLYLSSKGITPYEFYKESGTTRGILGQNNGISEDNISRFLAYAPDVNVGWLLTGEGNMLKSESDTHESVSSTEQPSSSNEGAPYYDVEFQGGFADSFNDQTIYPDRHIYIPGFERVQVWCNISGHSMEPRIGHQDIIGLRQCLVQDIQFGKIYAVVLKTKRTVKILRKSNNPQMLRYVPINDKEFDEQEFPITDIINIFEVLGGVAKFF
jgi:phage repressor protein C with HTH and peptisase S24 domain